MSLYKIRLNEHCISCGLCEKVCKGECINSKEKTADNSRCVACFNCLSACKRNALHYSLKGEFLKTVQKTEKLRDQTSRSITSFAVKTHRRSFLTFSVFSLFSATAKRVFALPDTLPEGESRVPYEMNEPILPPGAQNRERFQKKCTACHLCVSKCPSKVLTPSITELGLAGFLQPIVKFDHGYCQYNCIACTEVCPSFALTIIPSAEEKHKLQIGKVVFLEDNCVVKNQETNCGACAEHCPTGAITMIPYGKPEQALTLPVTKPKLCVGCGACECICPVRPYRAIYVQGQPVHGEAQLAFDPNEKQQEVKLDDFGF